MDTPAPAHAAADSFPLSRHPAVLAGTFIGFVALAEAGFGLAGHAALALPFLPASGVALAALVLFGVGAWPAVLAASLVVAIGVTRDPLLSMVTAGGQTLGAVAGAWCVGRFADGRDVFRAIRSTLRGVGIILASACVPALAFALFGEWRGGTRAAGGRHIRAHGLGT